MTEQRAALGIVEGTTRMPKRWAPWVRAPKLFPEGVTPVLFDDVNPAGILQGILGDCWLLSAIAALAEFPALLKSLFKVGDSHETARRGDCHDVPCLRHQARPSEEQIACMRTGGEGGEWWMWDRRAFPAARRQGAWWVHRLLADEF